MLLQKENQSILPLCQFEAQASQVTAREFTGKQLGPGQAGQCGRVEKEMTDSCYTMVTWYQKTKRYYNIHNDTY